MILINQWIPSFKDIEIQDIHSDSRRVSEGSLFVAIPGNRENGEDFVGDALNRGAKIIVTENSEINLKGKAAKLCVNDARRALLKLHGGIMVRQIWTWILLVLREQTEKLPLPL